MADREVRSGITVTASSRRSTARAARVSWSATSARSWAFYTTAFNDKNPRLAVELYGGPVYIQHNPLAANGFDAFIAFVEDFTGQFPDVHIDTRRVFAECDFVITHGLLTGATPVFGERGSKVVDIFRLNRAGKVVEHWDVLAPISATSANGNPEV